MRRSMPSEEELLANNSGLMELLIPGFLRTGQGHWKYEQDQWKSQSPQERAEDFSLRYGLAFGPGSGNLANIGAVDKGAFNEGNYWDSVIRAFIYGGHPIKPVHFKGQVKPAPYDALPSWSPYPTRRDF